MTPLPTSAAESTFQCNCKWDMGYPQIIQTPVQLTFLFRAGKWAYLQPLTSQCSPLTPASLEEASASAGAAARIAETRKHFANDSKCQELGWVCTSLAVESYGNRGMEAHSVFKRLASLIAIHQSCPKASVSVELYSHLNLSLVRSAARAILGREPMGVGG